jgi:hypothetical protein
MSCREEMHIVQHLNRVLATYSNFSRDDVFKYVFAYMIFRREPGCTPNVVSDAMILLSHLPISVVEAMGYKCIEQDNKGDWRDTDSARKLRTMIYFTSWRI